MSNIKYELNYSDEVWQEISELVSKYNLEIDPRLDLFERIKKESPRVVIFKLAEKIVNKEGKFKDIIEALKRDLEMNQEDAEKLAHDIKDKIVPLADIIAPEEEFKKTEEPSVQELLIEKIKREIPNDENTETINQKTGNNIQKTEFDKVKEAEVEDVEKNAEKLKKIREETVKPGTMGGQVNRGQMDKYREPTE